MLRYQRVNDYIYSIDIDDIGTLTVEPFPFPRDAYMRY